MLTKNYSYCYNRNMEKKTYSRQLKIVVGQGKQYTTNKELAADLGKEQGKHPIDFISPRLRETFLKAWPELGMTPEER